MLLTLFCVLSVSKRTHHKASFRRTDLISPVASVLANSGRNFENIEDYEEIQDLIENRHFGRKLRKAFKKATKPVRKVVKKVTKPVKKIVKEVIVKPVKKTIKLTKASIK